MPLVPCLYLIWYSYNQMENLKKPGVDILPLIHKCFPYQPFKNQVILPQFSPKLPLNK